MIFAIVGTQLPFPRLMTALDEVAGRNRLNVLAQTADPDFSGQHMKTATFLRGAAFDKAMEEARVIVAHAGIGAIMGAADAGKPIIIMPRRADLGEHRNDHQLATARRFADVPGLTVIHDAKELEMAVLAHDLRPVKIGDPARVSTLVSAIARAIS